MFAGGGWGKELLHESVVGEYTLWESCKMEQELVFKRQSHEINVTLPLHMPLYHMTRTINHHFALMTVINESYLVSVMGSST